MCDLQFILHGTLSYPFLESGQRKVISTLILYIRKQEPKVVKMLKITGHLEEISLLLVLFISISPRKEVMEEGF